MKKLLTFFVAAIMCGFYTNAQKEQNAWREIDSLFSDGLYKSALEKVRFQYNRYPEKANDTTFVRSVLYLMQCQMFLGETHAFTLL